MEVYLTKKVFDDFNQALAEINPHLTTRHRTRKKFMDIIGTFDMSTEELQQLKETIKAYFASKGIDVSFRV